MLAFIGNAACSATLQSCVELPKQVDLVVMQGICYCCLDMGFHLASSTGLDQVGYGLHPE